MTRAELEQKLNAFVLRYPVGSKYIGFNIPGQCVALCNQYWLDVWGLRFPLQGAATAYEILSKATNTRPDLFEKVINNPNDLKQVPSKGDVMIWNTKVAGGAGHCAIYLAKGTGVFTSLDQNWTANTVTRVTHDWNNIAGWIHNKTQEIVVPPVDPCADFKKQIATLSIQLSQTTNQVATVTAEKAVLQAKLEEADKKIKALEAQVVGLQKEIEALQAKVGDSTKWQTLKALLKELFS